MWRQRIGAFVVICSDFHPSNVKYDIPRFRFGRLLPDSFFNCTIYVCGCECKVAYDFDLLAKIVAVIVFLLSSGAASTKIWRGQKFVGSKMFDFSRITLFCLKKRLSKRKITIFFKTLGGHVLFGPPLATPMLLSHIFSILFLNNWFDPLKHCRTMLMNMASSWLSNFNVFSSRHFNCVRRIDQSNESWPTLVISKSIVSSGKKYAKSSPHYLRCKDSVAQQAVQGKKHEQHISPG